MYSDHFCEYFTIFVLLEGDNETFEACVHHFWEDCWCACVYLFVSSEKNHLYLHQTVHGILDNSLKWLVFLTVPYVFIDFAEKKDIILRKVCFLIDKPD